MGLPQITITPTGMSPVTLVDESQSVSAPYNPLSVTSITATKVGRNLQIKLADSTGNNFITIQLAAFLEDFQLLIDSLQKARGAVPAAPGVTPSLANVTISWTGVAFNPTFIESYRATPPLPTWGGVVAKGYTWAGLSTFGSWQNFLAANPGGLVVILSDGTNSLQITAKIADDFNLLLDQIQVEARHRIL